MIYFTNNAIPNDAKTEMALIIVEANDILNCWFWLYLALPFRALLGST